MFLKNRSKMSGKYLMLLKSLKLDISDIELTVYVHGENLPGPSMDFLRLEGMFAKKNRKLQGTPFPVVAQVKVRAYY